MTYDAIMMYKLRFIRGLNIQYSDKWITQDLKDLSKEYERVQSELAVLDIQLKQLAIGQGYEDLEYKSEL